jgi:hypothetical protein
MQTAWSLVQSQYFNTLFFAKDHSVYILVLVDILGVGTNMVRTTRSIEALAMFIRPGIY